MPQPRPGNGLRHEIYEHIRAVIGPDKIPSAHLSKRPATREGRANGPSGFGALVLHAKLTCGRMGTWAERGLAVWLLVATACGVDSTFVPLPAQAEGAGALIFATLQPGSEDLTFIARAPSDPGPIVASASSELTVLVYEETLEELGIEPGPLTPSDPDCSWVRPKVVMRLENVAGERWWAEVEEPGWLFEALIPDFERRCSRCHQVSSANFVIDEGGAGLTVAAFLTDDRVLLALRPPEQMAIMDGSGATTPVVGCPSASYSAVVSAGEDRFWLGRDEALDFVEIDAGAGKCTLTSSIALPGVASIEAIDGVLDPAQPEMFLGTSSGGFYLVTNSGVEPIADLPPTSSFVGVARLGPRTAAVVAGGRLAIWDDGGLTMIPTPRSTLGGDIELRRIVRVEALGAVVGGTGGEIFVLSERMLTGFDDSILSVGSPVGALARYRDGFFAVSSGQLYQWYPMLGFCPPDPILGLSTQNARLIVGQHAAFIPFSMGLAAWITLK